MEIQPYVAGTSAGFQAYQIPDKFLLATVTTNQIYFSWFAYAMATGEDDIVSDCLAEPEQSIPTDDSDLSRNIPPTNTMCHDSLMSVLANMH